MEELILRISSSAFGEACKFRYRKIANWDQPMRRRLSPNPFRYVANCEVYGPSLLVSTELRQACLIRREDYGRYNGAFR